MDDSQMHPSVNKVKFERTYCMIKPDGVMRGVVGDIIHRFERVGLKIVAMKMMVPTAQQVRAHYPTSDEAWVHRLGEKSISSLDGMSITPMELFGTEDKNQMGREIVEGLIDYMTSGPVVAMVVEGIQAIDMVRKLAGHTLPFKADVGTIRGDYSVDTPYIANVEKRAIHNLIHASETSAEAEHEIKIWFKGEKIPSYKMTSDQVMYSRYY